MKKSYYVILFCSALSFWRCDLRLPLVDSGLHFGIFNTTSDTITLFIPEPTFQLSTVGLPEQKPNLKRMITPNSKYGVFLQTLKHSNYFDELPTDTLHIFILNYNTYKDRSWEEIIANNLIMERILITEDSLETLEFLVTVD